MQLNSDGQSFILYIEIQTHNAPTMPLRMLRYFQEGIREGEFKKAQEIARSLLQLGVLAEEEIARIAGLPLEEIEKLRIQH